MTTATEQQAISLREVFKRVNDSRINYVVLQGYDGAPGIEPKQMSILTDNVDRFVRVTDAVKDGDHHYLYRVPGCKTRMYLMQKGTGFFPEPFETSMLTQAHIDNGIIRKPFNHLLLSARLYWSVYRESAHSDDKEYRRLICEYLENQMGPPVPAPDHLV